MRTACILDALHAGFIVPPHGRVTRLIKVTLGRTEIFD